MSEFVMLGAAGFVAVTLALSVATTLLAAPAEKARMRVRARRR